MFQKFQVDIFDWIEDTSKFNEVFIKNYNEESDEGYFLEVDVQYPEKIYELHNDLPFLLERKKLKNVEKLVTNLHNKIEHVMLCDEHIKFKTSTKLTINFEKSS